ncbi:MAG: hypothetical protein ABI643_03680 [Candidatus Doudnabacteria bacterium]
MKSKKTNKKSPIVHHIHKTFHKTIKKSTWMAREVVKFTGIPVAYSETIAWFAERMILGTICLLTAGFAGGVVFALYASPPIAQSPSYIYLADRAGIATAQFIDFASPFFKQLLSENYRAEKLEKEALALRKQQLQEYLGKKDSPFAKDDTTLTALASAKNMKLILAISFVESNFGKHCYFFNCSGIGGSVPNLRKYKSYAEWVLDFDKLLEDHYKGLAPEKFIGLYVQPGSPNWIYGVRKVLDEIKEQGIG